MRLIDADALKMDLTRFYDGEVCARDLIDSQPTIEQKQGEWIEMYQNGFGNMICMCSKCSFHASRSLYCPNCGARMI